MKSNLCIVIQARMGSTRLPNKILLPFYELQSILDIQIACLRKLNYPIVVATTTQEKDNVIESYCKEHEIACFRGSENDVLNRFISCAQELKFDRMLRICSDNPFLDLEQCVALCNKANQSSADYISFLIDGKPSIKTHYGFWAEYVTLNALKRVDSMTQEKLYHEHVTNYIYTNPESFKIEWINVTDDIAREKNVRLTIDTEQDFANASKLYSLVMKRYGAIGIHQVLQILDEYPEFRKIMKQEIEKNSK